MPYDIKHCQADSILTHCHFEHSSMAWSFHSESWSPENPAQGFWASCLLPLPRTLPLLTELGLRRLKFSIGLSEVYRSVILKGGNGDSDGGLGRGLPWQLLLLWLRLRFIPDLGEPIPVTGGADLPVRRRNLKADIPALHKRTALLADSWRVESGEMGAVECHGLVPLQLQGLPERHDLVGRENWLALPCREAST